MFTPVVKDFGDVWNRLFDHRPFLNGEIKYFIKEFEEKRNDRELSRLFETLANNTDVRDSQIPKVIDSGNQLEKLGALVDIAIQNCNTVVENERNIILDKALEGRRLKRKEDWKQFKEEMNQKYLHALMDATTPLV